MRQMCSRTRQLTQNGGASCEAGSDLTCDQTKAGGGLGSLTGAAYLLRDCGFEGKNIHIIEALPVAGGSNDACGAARMAVYQLLGMKKEVCPVKPIRYDARMIMAAAVAYLK